MSKFSVLRWIAMGLLMVTFGCQQSPSKEELGTVVYEIPKVPGSEETYPIPDLNPDAKMTQHGKSGMPLSGESPPGGK